MQNNGHYETYIRLIVDSIACMHACIHKYIRMWWRNITRLQDHHI